VRNSTYNTSSRVIPGNRKSGLTKSLKDSIGDSEPPHFSVADAAKIRTQLDSLLASPQFRTSRRCQLLLQHVTEKTLAGETGSFKERILGVCVFGRVPNYDTNQDPVVRATAGEVRKKLAQYYQEPGHENEIRFALLPGSYVPEFHLPEPAVVPEPPVPAKAVNRKPWWRRPLPVTLALVAVALACFWAMYRSNRSPLDQFWARTASSPSVLICLGQPPAYNFRSDKKQAALAALMEHPSAESVAATRQLIPLSDLVAMPDRYMALGDATCLLRLATFFEKRGTPYYFRGSLATTFEDLREHPAVLVGAFDNQWTLRFGDQLRFSFQKNFNDPAGISEMIRDRDHPERKNWKLVNAWPDWDVSTDYALISRVRDRETDRMLVIAAGITQYGTVAAGEFITNPDYFSEALGHLPKNWQKKNLQIVLEVPVVHGASGHPRVVATATW
jgi:hypothetical protein